jgi:protein-S-isoprenylcysteine O-methyltransferase Ste14
MSQEMLFKLILTVLAIVLYVNHHVIHRKPREKYKQKSSGSLRGIELLIALTASLWTVSLVLYVSSVPWFDWKVPLPLWLRWTGVVAMIACVPLSQWIYRTLGVHFSKKLELAQNHQLVHVGPYQFIRHPMYTTLFLCAAATCFISANALVLVAASAVALVFLVRIKKEESMLVARFGDEYRAYQRQTGALIPQLATIVPWRLNWH